MILTIISLTRRSKKPGDLFFGGKTENASLRDAILARLIPLWKEVRKKRLYLKKNYADEQVNSEILRPRTCTQ